MEIRIVEGDRKPYIPLLLEGDEDIAMLERYLFNGQLYALLENKEVITLALVVENELKNIVTRQDKRGQGYGSIMLSHLCSILEGKYLVVGTGDCSPARSFYEKNGFEEYDRRKGFFLSYSHPVIDNGRQLVDMILYRKKLPAR